MDGKIKHKLARMNNLEILHVRFHYNGEFVDSRRIVQYVGGDERMSYTEKDKISMPEIRGHLADHVEVKDAMQLN
uniref:Uncharacterized protein n=1 Tax=Oryza meridionalis TaxID=40149 RepID=A0A0E0E7D4_9ORYZ